MHGNQKNKVRHLCQWFSVGIRGSCQHGSTANVFLRRPEASFCIFSAVFFRRESVYVRVNVSECECEYEVFLGGVQYLRDRRKWQLHSSRRRNRSWTLQGQRLSDLAHKNQITLTLNAWQQKKQITRPVSMVSALPFLVVVDTRARPMSFFVRLKPFFVIFLFFFRPRGVKIF